MLVVELYNFVVDVFIDVRLEYGSFKGEIAGGAEFSSSSAFSFPHSVRCGLQSI